MEFVVCDCMFIIVWSTRHNANCVIPIPNCVVFGLWNMHFFEQLYFELVNCEQVLHACMGAYVFILFKFVLDDLGRILPCNLYFC